MNVELPPDVAEFVEELIAAGDATSPSEAVASGLRRWRRIRETESALAEGCRDLDEGRFRRGEDVFTDLRKRAQERISPDAGE